MPRICVIGAGPAGLTTGKNLLQAGLDNFVIYEKGERPGGNWVYSPAPGHSSIYQFTRTISSKWTSAFQDFAFPPDYPAYPSHGQMADYFESYARRFGILPHVRFGVEVVEARRLADRSWRVYTADGASEPFDALFVCSGHHSSPRLPAYPGVFSGRSLHSHEFKTSKPFHNDRVLVVGAGNSGCDIAVDLSRTAKSVALSLRRGYHVTPKFLFGIPSDMILKWFSWMPLPLLRRIAALLVRLATGPQSRWGFPQPDHKLFQSHPIVNSEILRCVRDGGIRLFPDVERFDGPEVRFHEGRSERFDSIIFCTGYEVRFPFFGPELSALATNGPLYLRMVPPGFTGLFFIGLFQPNGSIWPLVDLQAKLAANHLAGRYPFPKDMDARARAESETIGRNFLPSPRHRMEVDFHEFRRKLLRQIPRSAPAWPVWKDTPVP